VINNLIVRSLDIEDWVMKSKPLTIKNVEVQLQAMDLVSDKVDPEELVGTVNEIASLDLKFDKETYDKNMEANNPTPAAGGTTWDPLTGAAQQPKRPKQAGKASGGSNVTPLKATTDQGKAKLVSGPKSPSVKKSEDLSTEQVVMLVTDWSIAMGLEQGEVDDGEHILKLARELSEGQRRIFNNVLATKSFTNLGVDAEGLAEIAGCCSDIME
jgi:hypothetical protein